MCNDARSHRDAVTMATQSGRAGVCVVTQGHSLIHTDEDLLMQKRSVGDSHSLSICPVIIMTMMMMFCPHN